MFKRYVFIVGFTNLLDSNGEFSINNSGEVIDKRGVAIPILYDDDGFQKVNVLSWDGRRDYRVIDLVATHFKDLHIPKCYYNDIVAFVMDSNKQNTHASNIGYRFKKRIESLRFEGFYHVPGFTKFVLNENGQVIDIMSGVCRKYYITQPGKKNIKGGYYHVKYHSKEMSHNVGRHRMLCLTFKDYPDNVDVMTVNHINGIPGDDRLENLEWTTRSENNTHAYINDLKNQHMRVLCRDVLTGEVVEYYSISECARSLGMSSDEAIRFRLYKGKFSQVFQDGKQFKFKNDERDWIIPDDPVQAIKDATQKKAVILRNCATNVETLYSSLQAAARGTGIVASTIKWRLDRDNRTPLFGYQVKFADDERPFPSFTVEQHKASIEAFAYEVEARNLLTLQTRSYTSTNQAVKDLDKTHLAARLRDGDQPLYGDGWQVKFKGDEWEEIKDLEETLYELTRDIMGRCEITGDIHIANNATELGETLNLRAQDIRAAAMTRGNKVYHGYRFRLGISDDPWPI